MSATTTIKTTYVKVGTTQIKVAKTAMGLMRMTWARATPIPDEQCFEAIKAGFETIPADAKLLLNSGEFYGPGNNTANLELLARFFTKYPQFVDRAFLSVKGGLNKANLTPDSSTENLKKSVDSAIEALAGTKKIDLFECARVDKSRKLADIIGDLAAMIKEGKFSYIGMSECKDETLRAAHAVHPIAAVEIEISPFTYEPEAQGVVAAAKELGIMVVAYSPLGQGMLTGNLDPAKLDAGDLRSKMARFKEEEFKQNLLLVKALSHVAEKKGYTPAQLSLAWVSSLGPHVVPLPGSSRAEGVRENLIGGSIELSAEDVKEIDDVRSANPGKGDRYFGIPQVTAQLWA